jgi:RimJ/RimL family protein N-acetyltransferase
MANCQQHIASYSVQEVLRDGTTILVRTIRADDKPRLLRHFQGLSPRSLYYRFFGLKRSLTDDDLRRLTELDLVNHVGLAATMHFDGDEHFIGVGRYIRRDRLSSAEVAFAVLDAYQGHGIGTLLLKHLARIARSNGIERLEADVMGGNQQMLEVFMNSGFREEQSYDTGVVHVSLYIDAETAK